MIYLIIFFIELFLAYSQLYHNNLSLDFAKKKHESSHHKI
jgi:hypothetical protein